jgi:hypothetical protein
MIIIEKNGIIIKNFLVNFQNIFILQYLFLIFVIIIKAKKVGKVLDNNNDDYEYNYRYYVYKDNIMTVEDHNQAYKDGNVTFSLKGKSFYTV